MKRIIALYLSFCFCLGISHAMETELHPLPHQVETDGKSIPLPASFRLIGTDELAPNTLRALLNCVDDQIAAEGMSLRVGIRGSKHVRKYHKQIPQHPEGYYLSITENEIVVAGYDNRGLYYSIRTLKQWLEQSQAQGRLTEVVITDWPDIATRGVVEGFYGQPWSHEARKGILDFCSEQKLNTYIYGPKNDRYHSSPHWRQPYPAKEAEQLRELVAYAHEREVDFVWAIHPGRDIKWTTEDRDKLVDKLESMYHLGVRAFAVFFDDIKGAGTDASKQVELMNYLDSCFVQTKPDVAPLIICPTEYNRSRWKPETNYLKTLGNRLSSNIHIMWTGDRALSDITADNLMWVQTLLKRKPYIWWNFPVTDFSNDRLLMGKVYGIDSCIRTEVSAFVSNPMEYAEASKLALFGVADYTWNINAYQAEASWEEGIRHLLPDAAEALACFCRHSSATGVEHFPREESTCIRASAERFLHQFEETRDWQAEDMKALQNEFERMESAADELKVSKSNPALIEEITPWITAMGLWARMGQEALGLAEAVKARDKAAYQRRLAHLQVLQRRIEQNDSETAAGAASIGTAVIQPLIKTIMQTDY